jgi:hypothetical protein
MRNSLIDFEIKNNDFFKVGWAYLKGNLGYAKKIEGDCWKQEWNFNHFGWTLVWRVDVSRKNNDL